MVDPIDANRRNWDERATIHARDTTGDYMLDRFRAWHKVAALQPAARGKRREAGSQLRGQA
jgi:hypothetical protein